MRILGLDYGSKTVGVAVSDPLGLTAQRLDTIWRKQENKLRQTLASIEALTKEYDVERIVVGYPKNMNNTVGERAEKALEFVGSQIKERTYLGADTRFVTEPEYPEFAWKELIVNAVAHRDYSIKGTDIQIKMFDDRLTVESPGTLPGIVRLNNMRHVHFSRNPKIAQFLHEYEYVQEFGEGVDRLYEVMEAAGLPQPEYKVEAFMLYATIRNTKLGGNCGGTTPVTTTDSTTDTSTVATILAFCAQPKSREEIMTMCGLKNKNHFIKAHLKPLLEKDAKLRAEGK